MGKVAGTALTRKAIGELLEPYLAGDPVSAEVLAKFETSLNLLLGWNARMNLTSVRDAAEIVRRHFGESIFAARQIQAASNLLDFGSGAGFPGLPIQLVRPDIHVTLAESQNKKATFLREAIRTLSLQADVWAARVETMPRTRTFDVVTLRAVDNMDAALVAAAERCTGTMVVLGTSATLLPAVNGFVRVDSIEVPATRNSRIVLFERQ